MTIASLFRLEKRIDPTQVMLEALTDDELGVLEEYNSLQKCSYAESEIEKMMPDYSMVFGIAAKMKAVMSNLTDNELQTLDEYHSLGKRGHTEAEIELMMGKATYASLSVIALR